MSWLEIGLFGTVVFALYYFQQMKITLKSKGFSVNFFTGWISDYQAFKKMIQNEPDPQEKAKCQAILNGLHLALIGLIVIPVLMFRGK
jgi:hypothetical protein